MLLFLLCLISILASGIFILQKISSVKRAELLFPAGSILGLVIFTFLLNFTAFFLKGDIGITFSFLLTLFLGFIAVKFIKSKKEKIDFPKGKEMFFWILSISAWGSFIYWKTAYALIGSDTNLYYAIAHSFVKGNFPFLTPWQPEILLSYHTGAFQLLGAFYFFSGLNFQFIHLFFSALFIFCIAQIISWLFERPGSIIRFLLLNLTVSVFLVSFGFIYITWPVFPLHLPQFNNINQFVLILRNLPTVSEAMEVYGAPINLDALIYFIFHAFGLAIFFSLLAILIQYSKERSLLCWSIICVGLATLALVNESIFLAAFPAFFFGILLIEVKEKTLKKNLKKLLLLVIATTLVISSQGGMISASLHTSIGIEKSAVIFPTKDDIKEDFSGYHLSQGSSRLLSNRSELGGLRWFHPGIGVLMISAFIAIFITQRFETALLIRVLFVTGAASLVAYNFIVPKFLIANGNRFLSAAFLFFSLVLCLSMILLFEKAQKSWPKKILIFVVIGWIFIPTILPSLALLTKNRFGENKLIPKFQQSSPGVIWLKDNLDPKERVIVLDKNAPHPSGQARALVEAGVLAPVFYGNYRSFTIEASPEFVDIAYYLSPPALKKLGIDILLIDNNFFDTLPDKRRQQLENQKYFKKIFDNSNSSGGWERIYQINDAYLNNDEELDGTFVQLRSILANAGKIYIDNEENFNPSFLRRPLIFSLRDQDLYYLPQSGVYLNVEANINSHSPLKDGNYDYFILGKNTQVISVCRCGARLIWKGIRDEVFVWERDY